MHAGCYLHTDFPNRIWFYGSRFVLFIVVFALVGACAPLNGPDGNGDQDEPDQRPHNIVLFIGDGMGFEQVEAASLYSTGAEGNLAFESFPYQRAISTSSASLTTTDSAAAATAMATGAKVYNGVISVRRPGDGGELETLLEAAKSRGMATGLVTTTYMTHATVAAFGAHEESRNNLDAIAKDYLEQTRPDVLLGGGANGMSITAAESAGYSVVTDSLTLSAHSDLLLPVSGQFGKTHLPYKNDGRGALPGLTDMVMKAVEMLSQDEDGFVLVAEAGRIDHAGHINDITRNIHETIELSDTVEQILEWADIDGNTLIVVTADHETGGLIVVNGNGAGALPAVTWATTGHTGSDVPLYADGPAAVLFDDVTDNTEIHEILNSLLPD